MKKIKKLSIKILLTLLLSIIIFWIFSSTIGLILRISNINFDVPKETEGANNWLYIFSFIIFIIMGVFITLTFTYLLDKVVIMRIKKLNSATQDVINGNFGIELETTGADELSNLTASFNKMTKELKSNEYLSKEFSKNVSHEFKTPISTIRAYGELIEMEAEKKESDKELIKQYSKIILDESDRLASLSKSILQLSLLDSTTLIKKDDIFSPAEQIRKIIHIGQYAWAEKKIEFDLRLNDDLITSNEQLLYQVWQNLINNAIKFCNDGDMIKIVFVNNVQGIYFEITDHGLGIKDEDKEKIFNQFFMADKSRNSEGSGLGLTIIKKIIEKLDGKIGFESHENEGTKFYIQINHIK